MKRITSIIFGLLSVLLMNCQTKNNFPITDLHIHVKGGFTIEDAVLKSKNENIRYGIVTNCGLGFPVHNDSQIDSVLLTLKDYPQFFLGLQAEGREWVNIFSRESMNKFDYTFVIRTYGEAVNPTTNVTEGRAWCEAIAQRVPDYFDNTNAAEVSPTDPALTTINQTFGRRFKIISFRWLTRSDI